MKCSAQSFVLMRMISNLKSWLPPMSGTEAAQ